MPFVSGYLPLSEKVSSDPDEYGNEWVKFGNLIASLYGPDWKLLAVNPGLRIAKLDSNGQYNTSEYISGETLVVLARVAGYKPIV